MKSGEDQKSEIIIQMKILLIKIVHSWARSADVLTSIRLATTCRYQTYDDCIDTVINRKGMSD